MSVFPMFAAPMARCRAPDAASLNAELRALFLRNEADAKWRNSHPTMPIPKGLYESRFDLFSSTEPSVQRLHEFCMLELFKVVGEVNGFKLDKLRTLETQTFAWFHITRRGGRFRSHNHPMASWSGVYCVDAGRSDPDVPDSGLLHFQHPNQASGMFTDPANLQMVRDYSLAGAEFNLQGGDLVIFPSWLFHEVFPFHGDGERITVAFNCCFRTKETA